ncbi:MAG: hypothetical protein WA724_06845 [Candidatus Dormiibacterota bacterium]
MVGLGVGWGELVGLGVGCEVVLVGEGSGLVLSVSFRVRGFDCDVAEFVFDWERTVVGGGVGGGVGGDGRANGEITCGTPPGALSVGGDLGCGWGCGPNEKLDVMA